MAGYLNVIRKCKHCQQTIYGTIKLTRSEDKKYGDPFNPGSVTLKVKCPSCRQINVECFSQEQENVVWHHDDYGDFETFKRDMLVAVPRSLSERVTEALKHPSLAMRDDPLALILWWEMIGVLE